jgi:hypothetical protein
LSYLEPFLEINVVTRAWEELGGGREASEKGKKERGGREEGEGREKAWLMGTGEQLNRKSDF